VPSIRPFKAVIYNKKQIRDYAKVVAPPYDVISPAMQEALYKKHKKNVVRLILGKIRKTDDVSDNRYVRAKKFMESWFRESVLTPDDKEAIYLYLQKYRYENKWIERIGFMSLIRLEMDGKKKVLPHENTLKAPKMDRLNLMKSVTANLSPIFMLYEDDRDKITGILRKTVSSKKPFININIDNIHNRVWKISEKGDIKKIEEFMKNKDVFIADGHHRYETAVNYAAEIENSDAPKSLKDNSRYALAYFCKLDDRSLTILPTHRLIKDIGRLNKDAILKRLMEFFVIDEYASAGKLISALKKLRGYHAFGMYMGGKKFYCMKLKDERTAHGAMGKGSVDWKNLDVAILHLFIIQNILAIRDEDDNIEFVKDAGEAVRSVAKGRFKLAFLLNPTKVTEMKKVAEHGEKMPRKATYFYPKLLSGLVINKF
jgi:uncharacterized protein (DUF1015 family)